MTEEDGRLWNRIEGYGMGQKVMEWDRRLWNGIEGYGMGQKVMEWDRRLWNLMEVSGKHKNVLQVSYAIERESGLELGTKKERKDYVRGRQSVTLPPC